PTHDARTRAANDTLALGASHRMTLSHTWKRFWALHAAWEHHGECFSGDPATAHQLQALRRMKSGPSSVSIQPWRGDVSSSSRPPTLAAMWLVLLLLQGACGQRQRDGEALFSADELSELTGRAAAKFQSSTQVTLTRPALPGGNAEAG